MPWLAKDRRMLERCEVQPLLAAAEQPASSAAAAQLPPPSAAASVGDAVLHPLLNAQGSTTRVRFLSVRESSCPDSGDNSVPIRREIQSVWEAFFADDERKDVTLQLTDGTEVLAHGSLLMAASPVFKAMLSHDMEEKQRRVIKLPGFSRAEVRFFLRLVYTGGV